MVLSWDGNLVEWLGAVCSNRLLDQPLMMVHLPISDSTGSHEVSEAGGSLSEGEEPVAVVGAAKAVGSLEPILAMVACAAMMACAVLEEKSPETVLRSLLSAGSVTWTWKK